MSSTTTPLFDISNLIGLNFEPLREVIEFLLAQLRDQNNAMLEFQEKVAQGP